MYSQAHQEKRHPGYFFLLVFLLSVPFWIIGGSSLPIPVNLPVSALAAVVPLLAALILVYWQRGTTGVKDLMRRTYDYKRIRSKGWFAVSIAVAPLIYGLAYVLMRFTGSPLPEPDFTPYLFTPVFFLVFWLSGALEELGWTGYATDPMQNRWGSLTAAVLLGIVWQLWHVIPDLQIGQTAYWIIWHALYSIALRVLIVWAYNNTGKSVFAAILVHTLDNVSWSLFPNYGSGLDPLFTAVIAWPVVAIIVIAWGPSTLTRSGRNTVSK